MFCSGNFAVSRPRMVFPSARTGNRNVTVSNPKKLPALPAVLILSHTKELPTLLPGMLMRLDIMPKVIICQNKQLYNRTYPNRRLHFNKVKSKNDFLKNIKKKRKEETIKTDFRQVLFHHLSLALKWKVTHAIISWRIRPWAIWIFYIYQCWTWIERGEKLRYWENPRFLFIPVWKWFTGRVNCQSYKRPWILSSVHLSP